MRAISDLIEKMDEEIEDAKEYAESYLTCKVKGDSMWANRYKEMAGDELKHSGYIHEKLINMIDELSRVYEPPVEMEERWKKEHKVYMEDVAFVRSMLAM